MGERVGKGAEIKRKCRCLPLHLAIKQLPPPSAEAFVSRLMVQVNCTGDCLWGNRWAQMCSKTICKKKKEKNLLFLSSLSLLFFLILSTGVIKLEWGEVKISVCYSLALSLIYQVQGQ